MSVCVRASAGDCERVRRPSAYLSAAQRGAKRAVRRTGSGWLIATFFRLRYFVSLACGPAALSALLPPIVPVRIKARPTSSALSTHLCHDHD
eukprot:scaffold113966_cov63-Phaeocystis_antarctica.AAC.6